MYRKSHALLLAVVALPLCAIAADQKADHTGCDNVNWNKEVLEKVSQCPARLPEGRAARRRRLCPVQGRDRRKDKEGITVHMKDRDGKNMTKIKFGSAMT